MKQKIKDRVEQIKKGQVPEGYKKTKIGMVPSEWEETTVNECLKLNLRPIPKPKEQYWRLGLRSHARGTFHELVESPEKVSMDELYIVHENDFIINITFAWEHAVAVAGKYDHGKLVSHRFPTYISTGKCNIEFWSHYSKRNDFKVQLELISPGGAGRNRVMSKTSFLKLPINLPNILEQQKIATILSTQDKVIELKEKLISEKEKQKKYLMQTLLTGKKRLNGFSGEWKKVKLGDIFDIITDYVAAGSFADIAKNVEYKYDRDFAQLIRTIDLKNDFNTKNCVYVDEHAFNYLWRVNLNMESIVLPNVGNCGEVYYIDPYRLPYKNNVLGPNAILMRSSLCNNKFLFYLFGSVWFQKQLKMIVTLSGQNKFNKTALTKLVLVIPNYSEQQAIANILTTADREIELLKQDLEEEKRKKKSLMQLLLTGIVRVTDC